MKLRPRTKVSKNGGITTVTTAPVLPPDDPRLHTPPVSELSNAGSTTAGKRHLPDLSSSLKDDSGNEETLESSSPTKDRRRPRITIPPAPLTKNNLDKFQVQIISCEEDASEDEASTPAPTPSTRLVQARNFLLAENHDTCPELSTRLERIADYLRKIPQETKEAHSGIYEEIKDLLRSHRVQIIAREGSGIQSLTPAKAKRISERLMSLYVEGDGGGGDDDDDDVEEEGQKDPFEWTNKFDHLIDTVRLDPNHRKPSWVLSQVRNLARPLNGGRLPSADLAGRLINEQIIKEKSEKNQHLRTKNKKKKTVDIEKSCAFENDLPSEKKRDQVPLDRRTSGPIYPTTNKAEDETGVKRWELGMGNLMPREVRDFDWERDHDMWAGKSVKAHGDDGKENEEDGEEAQILLAETPFLQMLMGEQVQSDLASGEYGIAGAAAPSLFLLRQECVWMDE